MTPFLYHTRTLASLQWTRASVAQPQLRKAVSRRHFSGSIAQHVNSKRIETTTTAASPEENKGPTISRTTAMHNSEPQFSGDYYKTHTAARTVAGKPQKEPSIVRNTARHADIPWDTTEMMDNDFEYLESNEFYDGEDEVFEDENEHDAWTRKSDPSQDRQTTITPSERAAFEAIFKNIRSKMKNAQRYDGFHEQPSNPAASRGGNSSLGATHASLEGIMDNAMTADIPWTRAEKQTMVNRYPPSLRALAAKAVGLDFDESHYEEASKEEEEALDSDQLEELRKPIREEVEAKMHAAKTDFELWAVMEQEVFPLVSKLGLEDTKKKETPPKKRAKKAKIPKSPKTLETKPSRVVLPPEEEQIIQFGPIVHEGQVVSPLALYGPLYPSYLLLGLRLLDRSFARPSPLTLSILPKIKSLGLISHVLGASTQLYNELLIIYWYRYNDFRGSLNLLSEIEQSGLNFDTETLDIVDDIRNMQIRILRGDRGKTLRRLWRLPEFAPGKFVYWSKKIRKILSERQESGGRLAY